MRYASDVVRESEITRRSDALVGWALSSDTRLSHSPIESFDTRGFSSYKHFVKAAVDATDAAAVTAALAPLSAAFAERVEAASLVGRLHLQPIPLDLVTRFLVGGLTGHAVAEGALKPVSTLSIGAVGPERKVSSTIVLTSEAARSADAATQTAITNALTAATSIALDAALVAELVSGTSAGSTDAGTLLAALDRPARPVIISDHIGLLALGGGVVRDLAAIGVATVASPAAAGYVIALDAANVLFAGSLPRVDIARHANVLLDDGTEPAGTTTIQLFQQNAVAMRAEQWFKIAARAGAVAFASTGSPS